MNDETKTERTTFEVPVYASVWKSDLESYLEGSVEILTETSVSLHVGTVPTNYSEYDAYMPVGNVIVKIPSKDQRIQSELLALDAAIEAEKERSILKLEDFAERKKELLALPHLTGSFQDE